MEEKDLNLEQTLTIPENQSEVSEISENPSVDENVVPVEQQDAKKPGPQESFKALREIKERAERERDEYARRLKEYEERHQQSPTPQQELSEDDDITLGPDELAEGKHLSKVGKKIKKLEQQLHQYQQHAQTMAIETRLKSEYPDFDKIVSKTNIDLLREMHPHIANTLNSATDLYSKAVSAYTLIKNLGIHVEDTYVQDRQLAQKNSSKPRPLASVSPQQGDSPLSRANAFANGLTEELKTQLRKEMEESRRGY